MPQTSSAPGSQPQAVADKNRKTAVKAASSAVKTVAKQTAKAVTTGTTIQEAATATAHSVASGTTSPTQPKSRPKHPPPAPKLKPYKPPKPIAVKVQKDLAALPKPQAQKAAKKPIYVGPQLKPDTVKTRPHKTLVSTDIAVKASAIPQSKRLHPQKPQKVKAPSAPQAPKAKKPQHKALKRAVKQIPDMGNARKIAPFVVKQAKKRGLQPSVLMAQIEQESGFDPLATEHEGKTPSEAQGGGETQFIPSTAAQYGVKYGDSHKAVRSQLRGQAKLMQDNGGTTATALGAYYGDHNPNGAYAQSILAKASAYTALDKGVKGGPLPQSAAAPKMLPGRYSGSKTVVQQLVGSKVRGDHGGTKFGEAPGVHTPGGDHYDPNSYAQDINGDNPREREPAYSQGTLDKIVRNARKFGFQNVPDLKIGQNYEGVAKGYRLQLLTNEGGTVNHIHVGIRWEGAAATSSPTAPTTTGAPSPSSATVATGGTPGGSSSPAKERASRRRHKRRRSHKRPRVSLSALPAPLNPADYQAKLSADPYTAYIDAAPSVDL